MIAPPSSAKGSIDHRDPLAGGNNFDLLRMALALLVVVSHSFPLSTGSEAHEPVKLLTKGQTTGGAIAVDLFFVISGFLITASYDRCATVWTYLRKRVARIYPGFVVAMLLGLVVARTLGGATFPCRSETALAVDFIGHVARLTEFSYRDAFPNNPYPGPLNGSLWSIPYEFWCYLGVAGLGSLGLLHKNWGIGAIFLFAMAARVSFAITGWNPGGGAIGRIVGVPHLWARLLPLYMAGVLFYTLRFRIAMRFGWALVAAAALAIAARVTNGWTVVFPIAGSYLVFFAAFHPRLRVHRFAAWGDFSYGTYLYAFLAQQCIMRLVGTFLSPWLLAALSIPVTLALAIASWFLVERRFLRNRRRTQATASDGPALTSAGVQGS